MTYLLITLTCLVASQATYMISHKTKLNSVKASSLTTLLFIGLTHFLAFPIVPQLQAAFFGGSFVGMSEVSRLSQRAVFFGGLIFSGVFSYLLSFEWKMGGTLGAAAFFSCLSVHLLRFIYRRAFLPVSQEGVRQDPVEAPRKSA